MAAQQPLPRRGSVIAENEEFYRRHKAELEGTAASLRLSGRAFLCLGAAGVLKQAWAASGGLFLPTTNLDQLAFGCFLLHAGALLSLLLSAAACGCLLLPAAVCCCRCPLLARAVVLG